MTDPLTNLIARNNRMMEEVRPMLLDKNFQKYRTVVRDVLIHLDSISSYLTSENIRILGELDKIRRENSEAIMDELENYRNNRHILEIAKKVMQFEGNEDDSSVG